MSSFLPSSSKGVVNLRLGGADCRPAAAPARRGLRWARAMMVHLYDYDGARRRRGSGHPEPARVAGRAGRRGSQAAAGRAVQAGAHARHHGAPLHAGHRPGRELRRPAGRCSTTAARPRRFVAIDEAKAVLDRYLPATAIAGTHDWDVARLHEPYGDGSYHGKLLKRVRKQLRSVSSRDALVTPVPAPPGVGPMTRRRRGRPYQPYPTRTRELGRAADDRGRRLHHGARHRHPDLHPIALGPRQALARAW